MDANLKKLLCDFIHKENVVGSWGISNIQMSNNTISFNVSGFKYKGVIEIKAGCENYHVCIGEKHFYMSINELANRIDQLIECTDNYDTDIMNWINTTI